MKLFRFIPRSGGGRPANGGETFASEMAVVCAGVTKDFEVGDGSRLRRLTISASRFRPANW